MAITKEMEDYALANMPETKKTVRELCGIPAPSHHEEKRAEYCAQFFRNCGGEHVYIDEALNAICEYNMQDSKEIIVFMAHTDTVFPDMEPMPFYEKDGKYFCPGVTDDTGNLSSLLAAAKYVISNKIKTRYGMLFVANSCEEGLGNLKGSKAIVAKYGDRIRHFITVDGTSLSRVVTRAVGSHRYKVTVKTEGGHSYGAFGNRNAVEKLSSIISTLYSVKVPTDGDSKTTYNVGVIGGGTSVNTIPEEAWMFYEYRSDSLKCLSFMKEMFDKVIEAYQATGLDVSVEILGERPCAAPQKNQALYDELVSMADSSIRRITGTEPAHKASSTDANTALGQGLPAICLGGCVGSRCHTREEWLDPETMLDGTRLLLDFMSNYFC